MIVIKNQSFHLHPLKKPYEFYLKHFRPQSFRGILLFG